MSQLIASLGEQTGVCWGDDEELRESPQPYSQPTSQDAWRSLSANPCQWYSTSSGFLLRFGLEGHNVWDREPVTAQDWEGTYSMFSAFQLRYVPKSLNLWQFVCRSCIILFELISIDFSGEWNFSLKTNAMCAHALAHWVWSLAPKLRLRY